MTNASVQSLADAMDLGSLLQEIRDRHGEFDLLAHWKQGEFHHDVVLRVHRFAPLPAPVLVVSTNCNGGVKEVLCLGDVPERYALWHHRCPGVPEFSGDLPPIAAQARTSHYFDPCELLATDARSELRPEFRERDVGGGWRPRCGQPGPALDATGEPGGARGSAPGETCS
ncbi:hypothetical protein [Sorangium atrum]|uniref:Uncharacterized protein n=1 Tax=Sorangium atrum TaxID=2995308 RepID=A0ABT5CF35_9BACT|nr:hypothetical protein [Sorangium aterium]MDC0685063.1 hypothetical protein [Sorangium aterium]